MKPEPMFPPVAKTYEVFSTPYEVFSTRDQPIGEINAADVHEAFRKAREQFGEKAQVVMLKQ